MNERQRAIERELAQFEGLIAETARQILAEGVELEFEDTCQLLRVKAWRAIERYDASRTPQGMSLRRWVFGCLLNLRKDIEKRPRRRNCSIDGIRARLWSEQDSDEWFDRRYLSVDAEVIYFEVEEEGIVLPSTLNAIERRVVELRLQGRLFVEIDELLALPRAQRERLMRSVREKLADWAPTRTAPTPPLPGSGRRQQHQRPVHAAL